MVVTSAGATGAEMLLDGLTSSQRQAVATTSTTVCVLASAGAGKTRVLTRRIAFRVATGSAKAGHALAITFTRKAGGELRERLGRLGLPEEVTAGTFHSAALAQLRRWWADRRTPEPGVLQRKGRLIGELVSGRPGLDGVSVADLAAQVEWAKARMISPGQFAEAAHLANRALPADAGAIAALYSRYEDEKQRRRLVDFDDLLERYADALCSDSRFAAAQRWKWRHVFVDELQDLNPLQAQVLLSVLGDNEDLFVVGDPHQAIYGWNGADPSFLTDFAARWPSAEVVHLDDNHRSTPQVVAAAAAVLGRQSSERLRSSRPDGPLPTLRSFPSEVSEAAGIATQLKECAGGQRASWADMAVLARTNAQVAVVARALASAGVPFRALAPVEDGEDGWATAQVAQAVAAPDDQEAHPDGPATSAPSRVAITREGARPTDGEVTVCSFHRAKGLQWRAVWVCGLEAGLVPIGYATSPGALAEERRLLYVALTRAEEELHCSWSRGRRAGNGVALRREPSPWLPVLAPHCAVPADGECGPDHVSPATGAVSGASVPQGDAAVFDFLASARKRLSRTGRRKAEPPWGLGRPGQPDDDCETDGPEVAIARAAAERLRDWRRRLARASGVPPHVLLHDATIDALAVRRPSTPEELLCVPGLGPVKVARYGPAILEVVRGPKGQVLNA
ncbi:MAG TPA: ATP-dependent DNA helicase UvrD2 [Acidimicrobiales bacterium]|nr:ATP-dependent DNA helicase UvrD2 [Acidimicrobiales bacterium]